MPHKDRQRYLQYHKDYIKKNPLKIRNRRLIKNFGITLEQYVELSEKQHGVCAICLKPESTVHSLSKKVQSLSVDHNHETKQVRGLLCSKCNTALGLLDENPAIAQALIIYLEKFK